MVVMDMARLIKPTIYTKGEGDGGGEGFLLSPTLASSTGSRQRLTSLHEACVFN